MTSGAESISATGGGGHVINDATIRDLHIVNQHQLRNALSFHDRLARVTVVDEEHLNLPAIAAVDNAGGRVDSADGHAATGEDLAIRMTWDDETIPRADQGSLSGLNRSIVVGDQIEASVAHSGRHGCGN